jgi:hypothetical protein
MNNGLSKLEETTRPSSETNYVADSCIRTDNLQHKSFVVTQGDDFGVENINLYTNLKKTSKEQE